MTNNSLHIDLSDSELLNENMKLSEANMKDIWLTESEDNLWNVFLSQQLNEKINNLIEVK